MENISKQISHAVETHRKMLDALEKSGIESIRSAAELIISSIKAGGCVYICGNGGSAADAQHIAAELIGRFRRERRALPAVALTTDTSAITSISNDYDFANIFSRQLQGLAKEGDILWAISTSGTSKNVVEAVRTAKEKKGKVLAFTGRRNSELEKLADTCFCAADESTARSQEIHQLAYHIICDIVEQSFCEQTRKV
ncbi:MAG: SIS domain-containing protein [Candidatus Brocadiia bacterium]|nr:MAG: SIS domain-containing protein [Candidatus Brocadiia bacterium]